MFETTSHRSHAPKRFQSYPRVQPAQPFISAKPHTTFCVPSSGFSGTPLRSTSAPCTCCISIFFTWKQFGAEHFSAPEECFFSMKSWYFSVLSLSQLNSCCVWIVSRRPTSFRSSSAISLMNSGAYGVPERTKKSISA